MLLNKFQHIRLFFLICLVKYHIVQNVWMQTIITYMFIHMICYKIKDLLEKVLGKKWYLDSAGDQVIKLKQNIKDNIQLIITILSHIY